MLRSEQGRIGKKRRRAAAVVVLVAVFLAALGGGCGGSGDSGKTGAAGRQLTSANMRRLMDPATRIQEARSLGEAKVKAAADILGQLSQKPDPEFRQACVWALGEIGDPQSVHTLRFRQKDKDDGVRAELATALGKLGGTTAFQILNELARDRNASVRAAVASAMAPFTNTGAAIRQLQTFLNDPDRDVRVAALEALAGSDQEEATSALVRALEDPDESLRMAAAEMIAGRRTPAAMRALGGLIVSSDPAVRAVGEETVLKLGETVVPFISKPLLDADSVDAQASGAALLSKVGGEEAVKTLIAMLDRMAESQAAAADLDKLRASSIQALIDIGPAALPQMQQQAMFGELSLAAEKAVAQACIPLGKPAAQAIVEGILRWKLYPSPAELAVWIEALGEIGDPAALPALNRALSQEIEGMPELVAQARKKIEARSGARLADPKPDPVAFHAPAPEVGSLDLDPGPQAPYTKPVNRIPDDGVIWLGLRNSVGHSDPPHAMMEIELIREGGKWRNLAWARARRLNQQHHQGHILSETTSPDSADLHIEFAVINDIAVRGGYAEYKIRLRKTDAGMTCEWDGHFNFKNLEGTGSIDCREGKNVRPAEPAVAAREHPRLSFRRGDLPALRARAATPFGRRILKLLRARAAAGKEFDYKRRFRWEGWSAPMERAMARSLFAQLFDDAPHGKQAAVTAMIHCENRAYGGQHGSLQATPLQILGYGYDMAYPFWTPEQQLHATDEIAYLWSWILPNSSVQYMGETAFSFPAPAILAMLREPGPLVLIDPGKGGSALLIEAPDPPPSSDHVPVNTLEPDKLLRNWLTSGELPAGDDNPLRGLGGPAGATPSAGTEFRYRGEQAFNYLKGDSIRETPALPGKEDMLAVAETPDARTYLYSLLKVDKKVATQLDCSHPMGFLEARIWINGKEVASGNTLTLEPGLHRIMLEVEGSGARPVFYTSHAAGNRAEQARGRAERVFWQQARQHHERTGERGEITLYARKLEITGRRLISYEQDQIWRGGHYRGVHWERTLDAFQRVWGIPFFRDCPMHIQAYPRLALQRMSDVYLCHTIHLASPELRSVMKWEFDRRFASDERLEAVSTDALIAAFVNYPLEVEAAHPDDVLPNCFADPRRGGYFFHDDLRDGDSTAYLCANASPKRLESAARSVGGLFHLKGFGKQWLDFFGNYGRHGIQNIVEIDGSKTAGFGKVIEYKPGDDGSGSLVVDMSDVYNRDCDLSVKATRHLCVDFTGDCGAPALVALADHIEGGAGKTLTMYTRHPISLAGKREFVITPEPDPVPPEQEPPPPPPSLHGWLVGPQNAEIILAPVSDVHKRYRIDGTVIKATGMEPTTDFLLVMTIQPGGKEHKGSIAADGAVEVGNRTVRFDGNRLTIGE